jgi:hypothetical protein
MGANESIASSWNCTLGISPRPVASMTGSRVVVGSLVKRLHARHDGTGIHVIRIELPQRATLCRHGVLGFDAGLGRVRPVGGARACRLFVHSHAQDHRVVGCRLVRADTGDGDGQPDVARPRVCTAEHGLSPHLKESCRFRSGRQVAAGELDCFLAGNDPPGRRRAPSLPGGGSAADMQADINASRHWARYCRQTGLAVRPARIARR